MSTGAGAHVAERLVSILMMDHNYPGNILSSALPLCSGHHNPAVHTTSKCASVVFVCRYLFDLGLFSLGHYLCQSSQFLDVAESHWFM